MTIKAYISVVFFLFCISYSYSQSFEHRKFKYDWNDAQRVSFKKSDKFRDHNAVVLFEETTINVELQHIKRYQVIQFDDQSSIAHHNLFRVPIPMDTRNASLYNIYRPDTASFPQLLYEKINFFDARIIRNGEFIKAVLDEVAFRKEERTGEYLIPYYIHYFYVRNLEPGDQLEVIISHHWPLHTFKYYLNDLLPKQEVFINVNNTILGQVNTYINSNLADFIENDESADKRSYRLSFANIESVDPRMPTNVYSLPRIEFFENKIYEITNRPFGEQDIDTIRWSDFLYRMVTRIDPGELRTWENYDLQSYKTSLFFDKMKKLAGEKLMGIELMKFIHQYSCDHLGYKNDFRYFIHEEHGFHDLGSYLERDTLREASRYEFYFNMLDRVNQPWYKVLLQDKRLQVIDTASVGVYYPDHLSYVMFDKDSMPVIFYPKGNRFGYYVNELPFYLTDQFVYLIPQTVPRKIYDKEPGSIKYPLIYLTHHSSKANIKKHKTILNISLKEKQTSVESRIFLSGQFSTLTRGYYQYGYMDTTISPAYYTDVFKQMNDVTITQDSAQKLFPFAHHFTIKGSKWENVYATVDGKYMIDLADLISMHYENLDPLYFKANYRHDFEGKEEFIIELNFDQLVKIPNMESCTNEIIYEEFKFSSSLVKIADNQYGLKITWEILKEYTEPAQIHVLSDVFNIIRKFKELKLKVTPQ